MSDAQTDERGEPGREQVHQVVLDQKPGATLAKRPGARIPAAMIDSGLPTLVRLASTGRGTPEALVEESRDPGAPFHRAFRFDEPDAAVAHEWRLHRARTIWSAVEVRYENNRGEQQATRAFVSVTVTESRKAYVALPVAVRDHREEVLARAQADVRAFRMKHSVLQQLMPKAEILAMFEREFFG